MSRATGRRDINKAGGEEAEFPIVCETCLGPNPYVRMTKQPLGQECKICTRPFTVFRWQPGATSRFKKTEVCQTCAKSKNVCQTCLLDLQFGLPTNVRDTALGITSKAPSSNINREYYAQNIEAAIENGIEGAEGTSGAINFGKMDPAGRELLKKLARNDPYYNRNRPHLCSFFAKGNCTRGDACPYRHELPKEGQLQGSSQQSIRDRYHGTNDPVARKMLSKYAASTGLAPPADTSITSLYFTSVPSSHNNVDALTSFVVPLTDSPSNPKEVLKNIVPVSATNCAFVNFKTREAAEHVAAQLAMRNIGPDSKGVKVSFAEEEMGVQWGRPRKAKQQSKADTSEAANGAEVAASA